MPYIRMVRARSWKSLGVTALQVRILCTAPWSLHYISLDIVTREGSYQLYGDVFGFDKLLNKLIASRESMLGS